jgi:hypothetical protein
MRSTGQVGPALTCPTTRVDAVAPMVVVDPGPLEGEVFAHAPKGMASSPTVRSLTNWLTHDRCTMWSSTPTRRVWFPHHETARVDGVFVAGRVGRVEVVGTAFA